MIRVTLAAAALLLAAPAQASTILPNLYAKTFCELRQAGASKEDARSAAMQSAIISGDDWTWITIDGRRLKSDVVLAVQAVINRCPELIK
jgi:hypothetical protein